MLNAQGSENEDSEEPGDDMNTQCWDITVPPEPEEEEGNVAVENPCQEKVPDAMTGDDTATASEEESGKEEIGKEEFEKDEENGGEETGKDEESIKGENGKEELSNQSTEERKRDGSGSDMEITCVDQSKISEENSGING